jgi:hypothetical protein
MLQLIEHVIISTFTVPPLHTDYTRTYGVLNPGS